MGFIKRNWFKILILLPIIPAVLFINSLDSFAGFNNSMRILAGLLVVATTLLILFFGFYLEFGKGDFKHKKFVFNISNLQFGIIEIARVVFSIFAITFFAVMLYAANLSINIGEILHNVAGDNPIRTTRDYSLVIMADFDISTQNVYNRIGVLAITDEEKAASLELFLDEQEYILNPIQVTFGSPMDLLEALYSNEVDAIIINSNFVQNFEDEDGFEFIELDTIVLAHFTVTAVVIDRDYIDPGEPFSILLLGLNTRDEISTGAGQINTFMLLTVNLQEMSFTLTSIPRDSYVWVPCFGRHDRLSHTNWSGAGCAVGAIESMFDIDIPYYVMLNFTGFMEIIDVLGGIYVDIPFRIIEQDSRRRFGEHLIIIEPGYQLLNAEQALAFSRHRNSRGNTQMQGDDFARVGHQQIVLQAMISRMFSGATGLADIIPLLEVLGRNVQTNLHAEEIMNVADYLLTILLQNRHVQGGIMGNMHFTNRVIMGDNAAVRNMSVILPWPGQIADARELMLINLGTFEPTFTFDFSFDGFVPPTVETGLPEWGTGVLPPGSVTTPPPANDPVEDPGDPDDSCVPYYPYPLIHPCSPYYELCPGPLCPIQFPVECFGPFCPPDGDYPYDDGPGNNGPGSDYPGNDIPGLPDDDNDIFTHPDT